MGADRAPPPGPARPVPRPERPAALLNARKAGPGRPDVGAVTYTVLDAPCPATDKADRRAGPRRRVRLRSGKVLDADGRFITECVMYDLSAAGSRIRPPAGTVLPDLVHLYDDRTGLLHRAAVLWRNGREVGVRFRPQVPSARMRAVALAMRRKFYAVRR